MQLDISETPILPHVIEKIPFCLEVRFEPSLTVKEKRWCWKCFSPCQRRFPCSKCRCITYCSSRCRKEDKKRHKIICRDSSYYKEGGAIIKVGRFSISKVLPKILSTAIYLIDELRIHPDNIQLRILGIGLLLLYTLKMDFPLLPFIERGLSPQKVINCDWRLEYITTSNLDLLLRYGTGKLNFPEQEINRKTLWFISHGIDANDITKVDQEYYYSLVSSRESDINLLASRGFNFHRCCRPKFRFIDDLRRSNQRLAKKVEKIVRERSQGIREILDRYLIPELRCIVESYLP